MAVSARELLKGSIDMHLHIGPSTHIPASLVDGHECAQLAGEAGMRAVVFKDQCTPTTDRAYFATKYANGAESFGGVVLNTNVGGLNKWAVIEAIHAGAKVIWFPAGDARNCITQLAKVNASPDLVLPSPEEAITILDENGELKPEVYPILDLIAEADIVMNTGHLEVRETLKLLKAAKEHGVKKMVVDHPLSRMIDASMEEMEEMVSYGAYLEHTFGKMMPRMEQLDPKDYAKVMKTFGAEHNIMSSDSGLNCFPTPPECMRIYIEIMRWAGLSDDEIVMMTHENPRKLLGID